MSDVEALVKSIRSKLEERLGKEKLKGFYITDELDRILSEFRSGCFAGGRTDIGAYAIKLFDDCDSKDSILITEIAKLDYLHRQATFFFKKNSQ